MKIELISSSHSVGEANYHMQFTPAYKRDIFADELVKILTRDYLLAAARGASPLLSCFIYSISLSDEEDMSMFTDKHAY